MKVSLLSLFLGAIVSVLAQTPSPPPPSVSSPALVNHASTAVMHNGKQKMLVFGGRSANGLSNQAWLLTANYPHEWHWESVTSGGSIPSPRSHHSLVSSPAGDVAVLYGGRGADGVDSSDIYLWQNNMWQLVQAGTCPVTSCARSGHTAVLFEGCFPSLGDTTCTICTLLILSD